MNDNQTWGVIDGKKAIEVRLRAADKAVVAARVASESTLDPVLLRGLVAGRLSVPSWLPAPQHCDRAALEHECQGQRDAPRGRGYW